MGLISLCVSPICFRVMNKEIEDINTEISCVSHEIRNHLSICDMYSKILEKNLEKLSIKNDSIDNAILCIKKSLQIINTNLFELKSLNMDKKQIHSFEEIVERAYKLAMAYICDKNINVEFEVQGSGNVYVDETRYISCIVNLIKNAIESVDENSGIVRILGKVNPTVATLQIINNGAPIKKELQTSIFEKGFTTKINGSGIGLWLCQKHLKTQDSQFKLVKSTNIETIFEITTELVDC